MIHPTINIIVLYSDYSYMQSNYIITCGYVPLNRLCRSSFHTIVYCVFIVVTTWPLIWISGHLRQTICPKIFIPLFHKNKWHAEMYISHGWVIDYISTAQNMDCIKLNRVMGFQLGCNDGLYDGLWWKDSLWWNLTFEH